jgi:hypothetical protein
MAAPKQNSQDKKYVHHWQPEGYRLDEGADKTAKRRYWLHRVD